ncbi:MAG: MarR family transcriptional regulator [Rhodothermaceae bacterium]|nr:MAG: MarR family transcriptional regulator [Rhodothermaceae bacterium]
MKLSELIRQERFASTGQEAMFNVIVTSSWLLGEMAAVMAPFGLTPAQYNVLRILRGSHPRKLTCSDLGARLLDRTPDVTRLLNRLERRDLIHRARARHDRRVVEVGITQKGLALLDEMHDVVHEAMNYITRHLSAEEHRLLCDLLERLRTDQTV